MKTGGIFLQLLGLVLLGFAIGSGLNEGEINLALTLIGLVLVLGGLFMILSVKRNRR